MIGLFTRIYVLVIVAVSLAALIYVYASPPPSLQMTRDGVPFFTPSVAHPETGEPLDLGELIRNYKGE